MSSRTRLGLLLGVSLVFVVMGLIVWIAKLIFAFDLEPRSPWSTRPGRGGVISLP